MHVVGSGGWVCVSSVSGGGGGGGGSTRTGSSLACVWRDAAAACRCGALHVSRLGSLPGRLAWPPLALPPSHPHSLGLSLLTLCLSLSARIVSLVATAKESIAHDSRVRVRYCGGAEAEHSQQSGQRTRNGGSICPAPFSFHVTHTFVLHCMCCQRDLHAIRPCGGCKPPIS